MADDNQKRYDAYWKANRRLIATLLAVWAIVSFGGGIFFVEALNKVQFFGLPLGFWIAQQGAIYVFVVLIFIYAWRMDKIDEQYRLDVDDDNE